MNPITHPKVPVLEGQLAVDSNAVSTLVGAAVVPLVNGDTLSYDESDAGYFGADYIPLTRVGDNTYLPMDVKADFRGAIQPWAQLPYFLQEPDGSVSALRPGYNGEFTRTFYAYSATGSYSAADFRLTDSEYRPLWLAADEYVSNILDGNEHGLLVRIRSTVDLTEQRYYWIDHNNTLDSRFHKFLDVTNNMLLTPAGAQNFLTPASIGGGCYIPEANLFVTCATNNINAFCYVWFTVDRPFQTTRSATIPNALAVKNVDWQDMSGTVSGTNNTAIVMDASTTPKEALYFKYINDPATRLGAYYTHPSSGRRQITYAYDAGVVRLFTEFFAYIPYAGTQNQFGWTVHMDYNVAANTLRYTPVTNDPQRFQTLPWVIRYNTAVDESAPPGSGGDNYKANKFPMSFGRNAALTMGNALVKVQLVGNKLVTHFCGTTQADAFGVQATDLSAYTGGTLSLQKMDALRRPYFMRDPVGYQYFTPYDASILSKALNHISFIGDNILRGTSNSKLYGQGLTTKPFLAYLPDTTTTGTVYSTDSNSYKSCFPTPSNVVQAGTNYALSSMTSYIDGTGPMVISRASWSSLDATAATWLALNINPLTGIAALTYAADPTTFRSKMNEITVATIAQSTFKPSAAYTSSHTLLPIVVIGANAYFLYSLTFGNVTEGVKYEYATLVLPIVGGSVVWPTTAASAVVSRTTGTLLTSASNVIGPQYFNDWEGLAVYRHTDGNYYVFVNPPTFVSIVGSNYTEQRMLKLNSSLAITTSTQVTSLQSWLGTSTGVHPKFGFYSTNTWNDSSAKCMMYYNDFTAVSDQASRIYQSAEKWLAGTGGQNTTFILSSKSASGFVLYSSEISVLMNGKVGIIPTQTIQLVSVVADPSNKTFWFYVQWNGTSFVLVPSLTAIPESQTSTYVGQVVTNATGISSSVIEKVTRIDTYRVHGSETPTGSAIRTLSSFTLTATPPIGNYVRPNSTLTYAATDLVSQETGVAAFSSAGSAVNSSVANAGPTVTYTPSVTPDTIGTFTYNVVDSIGNSGGGSVSVYNAPRAPINALMYATAAAAAAARAAYTPPPGDVIIDMTVVYDASNAAVWKYSAGAWALLSGVTVQSQTGYPVEVYNHITNENFFVRASTITGPGLETSQAQMAAWYPSNPTIAATNPIMANNPQAKYISAVTTDPSGISGNPSTAWRWCREMIVAQDTVVTFRIYGDDTINVYNSRGTTIPKNSTFTLTKGYNRIIIQSGNGGGTLTYVIFDMKDAQGNVITSSNKNEWTLMTAPAGEANTPGLLS